MYILSVLLSISRICLNISSVWFIVFDLQQTRLLDITKLYFLSNKMLLKKIEDVLLPLTVMTDTKKFDARSHLRVLICIFNT